MRTKRVERERVRDRSRLRGGKEERVSGEGTAGGRGLSERGRQGGGEKGKEKDMREEGRKREREGGREGGRENLEHRLQRILICTCTYARALSRETLPETRTHACTLARIHTCTHTHAYTRTRAHTHTHTHALSKLLPDQPSLSLLLSLSLSEQDGGWRIPGRFRVGELSISLLPPRA